MNKSRKSFSKRIMLLVLSVSIITSMSLCSLSVFASAGSGDINADGVVNVSDMFMLENYFEEPELCPLTDEDAADVDLNGTVNEYDWYALNGYLNGEITALPTCNTIALTSDVHNSTGISNLVNWLPALGNYPLDAFIFGGDYDESTNNTVADVEASCVQTIHNNGYSNTPVYLLQGNHDIYKSQFLYSQNPDVYHNYSKGLIVDPATHNYGVYIMDKTQSTSTPGFIADDIDDNEDPLIDRPTDLRSVIESTYGDPTKPIIIISHIPIHAYNNNGYVRQYANAGKLLEHIYDKPNVIFLWGHNHSQNDPAYSQTISSGSNGIINYAYNATTKKYTGRNVNFTYATMGGMMDGGGTVNGVAQDRYGMRLTINRQIDSYTNRAYVQLGCYGKYDTQYQMYPLYNYVGVYMQ